MSMTSEDEYYSEAFSEEETTVDHDSDDEIYADPPEVPEFSEDEEEEEDDEEDDDDEDEEEMNNDMDLEGNDDTDSREVFVKAESTLPQAIQGGGSFGDIDLNLEGTSIDLKKKELPLSKYQESHSQAVLTHQLPDFLDPANLDLSKYQVVGDFVGKVSKKTKRKMGGKKKKSYRRPKPAIISEKIDGKGDPLSDGFAEGKVVKIGIKPLTEQVIEDQEEELTKSVGESDKHFAFRQAFYETSKRIFPKAGFIELRNLSQSALTHMMMGCSYVEDHAKIEKVLAKM